MGSGIFYFVSLIGVALIAFWYIRNDNVRAGDATRGLLRMKPPSSSDGTDRRRTDSPSAP